jgi:DNA repair photolyase
MKLEPGAPRVSARFAAMSELAANDILTGVTLMPVLPFIEDKVENIRSIVERAQQNGASYIIPSFGMTLRDRQRDYYYNKLDRSFPGLRGQYERRFGNQYSCQANNLALLEDAFRDLCENYGIATRMPQYSALRGEQLNLL